jgi:hypothetical protein
MQRADDNQVGLVDNPGFLGSYGRVTECDEERNEKAPTHTIS